MIVLPLGTSRLNDRGNTMLHSLVIEERDSNVFVSVRHEPLQAVSDKEFEAVMKVHGLTARIRHGGIDGLWHHIKDAIGGSNLDAYTVKL